MSGDQRRDRQTSGESHPSSQRRQAASKGDDRAAAHDGEFDHPTNPRRETITNSESPSSESRISVNGPVLRAPLDSFNPVRVPPRSGRPSLALWTQAWATVALVIVVAGSAVGIVSGLRGRTLGPGWRSAQKDRPSASAAQQAPRGAEGDEKRAVPAAAPGYTAPHPVAAPQSASRSASLPAPASATPVVAAQETSTVSSGAAAPPRASPAPTMYRTTESLAISPPAGQPSGASPSHARRPKAAETEPRSAKRPPPTDEAPKASTPAPTISDPPEAKGESDAWVTEERRF